MRRFFFSPKAWTTVGGHRYLLVLYLVSHLTFLPGF